MGSGYPGLLYPGEYYPQLGALPPSGAAMDIDLYPGRDAISIFPDRDTAASVYRDRGSLTVYPYPEGR
jgi:hypothetical protein